MVRLLFGALLAVCLIQASGDDKPTPEQIARAIKELGDRRFAVREKATAFLRAAGRAAEPALWEAARSSDSEVQRRAQQILDEFRWGLYPDTPKPIVELVNRYQAGDAPARQKAVRDLLALGKVARPVLEKLLSADTEAVQRDSLRQMVEDGVRYLLPPKVLAEDLSAADELMETYMLAGTTRALQDYAAYQRFRGQLDAALARFQAPAELPAGVSGPELLANLYRMKGDLARALVEANRSAMPLLIENLLFQQGAWRELATQAERAGNRNDVSQLGLRAFYLRLAGDKAATEKLLDQIRSQAESEPAAVAETLLLHGRPHEALPILIQSGDLVRAFELLAAQTRYAEAFALVEKLKGSPEEQVLELEILKARTLVRLGERDQAIQLFNRLASELQPEEAERLGKVIEGAARAGLRDLAFQQVARLLGRSGGTDGVRTAFSHVYPKRALTAAAWWNYLRERYPDKEVADRLKLLRAVLDRPVSADFSKQLLEAIDRKLPPEALAGWMEALADTCLAAGKDDLSRVCLERWAAESRRAEASLKLAHFLARQAQWVEAARHYAEAAARDPSMSAAALYLRGWALSQAGQEAEGKRLRERASWLPLAGDEARYKLAEALLEAGLSEDALKQLHLLQQLGDYPSVHMANALGRLSDEAQRQKRFDEAARLSERVLLCCARTQSMFVRTEAYLTVPLLAPQNRARALLAAGRPLPEILEQVERCLAAWANDANLPIYLVPGLDRRGHQAEADRLFARVFTLQDKLCQDYPRSAWARNSAAWLAARCRRQLDKALEHALQAVKLAPEEPAYADTLAEVYFQRGDKAQALAWIKKCLQLDPKRDYFHRQLKRFEAGDPAVEPVEDE